VLRTPTIGPRKDKITASPCLDPMANQVRGEVLRSAITIRPNSHPSYLGSSFQGLGFFAAG
jgi:hypothetical protein